MKSLLHRFSAGLVIGIASSVPGVSGGTIAVFVKVYEKMVWATSHIFKSFKKSMGILLPIGIGSICASIPMFFFMEQALENFLFGAVCVFAGFITGSLPSLVDETKALKEILEK